MSTSLDLYDIYEEIKEELQNILDYESLNKVKKFVEENSKTSEQKLWDLALKGDKSAQNKLVQGYRTGSDGLKINAQKVIECAELNFAQARMHVAEGYANGINPFEQNPDELEKCAYKNWGEARFFVVRGYSEGIYGFKKDPSKIKFFAEL